MRTLAAIVLIASLILLATPAVAKDSNAQITATFNNPTSTFITVIIDGRKVGKEVHDGFAYTLARGETRQISMEAGKRHTVQVFREFDYLSGKKPLAVYKLSSGFGVGRDRPDNRAFEPFDRVSREQAALAAEAARSAGFAPAGGGR